MVVEDGLDTRRGELVAQAGGLLATELVVVCAAHLVRPPVALGLRQGHSALGEGLLKARAVDGAGVHQRVGDLVPERLLEPTDLERLATQVPVRHRCLRRGQHRTAFITHQLVVDLVEAVGPRGASLEGLAGELVVVDDVDVVVQVPARAVDVRDDQVVGAVHSLGQQDTQHVHP